MNLATQSSVVRDPAPTRQPVYRDGTLGVLLQREQLLAAYRAAAAGLTPELRELYRLRFGRVVQGSVMIATMVVMALGAFDVALRLWPILLATWPLGLLGLQVGRYLGGRWFDRKLAAGAQPGPDPLRDLDRLAHETPQHRASAMVARLGHASLGLPMVGLVLAAPLTMHFVVYLMLGGRLTDDFDTWIRLSAFLVGFAHIVLAILTWGVAHEIVVGEPRTTAAGLIGNTTLAACVPGIIAIAIPPLLVAVTAALFVPFMLAWARRRAGHENATLA
ncbi:MAG: hypothetical protein IT370_05230 [Deltaproteobacteria bacterium]|nr:hypothetical protein [Deltaproteobacteria bacterium]